MPEAQIEPDTLIGDRYRVQTEVGRGAMYRVFKAWDSRLDEIVALKVPHGDLDETGALFAREARLTSSLDHPNLVTVRDTVNGPPGERFLVTAWVDGLALDQFQQRACESDVLLVYAQIADGLAHLHQHGFLHRDLKPSNVLVEPGPPPVARLIDFGLAVSTREADALTGIDQTFVGTLAYINPEQLQGHEPGGNSDVFSLGVMLAEALGGRLPWTGEGVMDLALTMLRKPPDLSAVPAHLRDLVEGMLAQDPQARPTAELAAERLRAAAPRVLPSSPDRSKSKPGANPFDVNAASTATHEGGGGRDAPPARTFSAGVLLLATVGLSAIGWAGWLWGWWLPALVLGLALLAVGIVLRGRPAAAARVTVDPAIAARLERLENRLRKLDQVTDSIVADLGGMRSHLQGDEMKALVFESVIAALDEVRSGDPVTGSAHAVRRARAGTDASPEPWHQRLSNRVSAVGALVTLGSGLVLLLGNTALWKPNRVPEITGVVPVASTDRATRTRPFVLQVQAADADGDPLSYSYRVDTGSVTANGDLVTWRAAAGAGRNFRLQVTVSDGTDTAHANRSFRINEPPALELRGSRVGPDRARLMADTQDVDGDPLSIRWQVSCGRLSQAAGALVFLEVGQGCTPEVLVVAGDGLEETTVRASLAALIGSAP